MEFGPPHPRPAQGGGHASDFYSSATPAGVGAAVSVPPSASAPKPHQRARDPLLDDDEEESSGGAGGFSFGGLKQANSGFKPSVVSSSSYLPSASKAAPIFAFGAAEDDLPVENL